MSKHNDNNLYLDTKSKYKRNKEPRKQPEIAENEVRITVSGYVKSYVEYGLRLLQGPAKPQNVDSESTDEKENINEQLSNNSDEKLNNNSNKSLNDANKKQREVRKITKKYDTIVLKATGRAITTAVKTCETIKRLIQGLHQVVELNTKEILDKWDPSEENLKPVYTSRKVASIEIKLSRFVTKEEKLSVGYQPPINDEITNGLGRVSTNSYSVKKTRGMRRRMRGGYRRRTRDRNRLY